MTFADWMRDGVVDCRDGTVQTWRRGKRCWPKGKDVSGGVAAGDGLCGGSLTLGED